MHVYVCTCARVCMCVCVNHKKMKTLQANSKVVQNGARWRNIQALSWYSPIGHPTMQCGTAPAFLA